MKFQSVLRVFVGLFAVANAQLNNCAAPNAAYCVGCYVIAPCINGRPDAFITCAAIDPSKPLCSAGRCQATAPNCAVPTPPLNIACTGVGFYPDPADCSRYHNCLAGAQRSIVLNCPSPLLYNSLEGRCQTAATPANCDYQCATTRSMFVAYQPDPRFYFYCRPEVSGAFTVAARVMRCPEGHIYRGGTCSFVCLAEGRFVDPSNPTRYNECLLMPGGTFITRAIQCPVGMIVADGLCVVG